jgi:uncharacterized protein
MVDEVTSNALLCGVGAVGIGAGVLAMFPALAATVSRTTVLAVAGTAVIHQLGDRNGATTTETTRDLAHYEAVVWSPNPGDVLDGAHDWLWTGGLVGGYRGGEQEVTLLVEDVVESLGECRDDLPFGVRVFLSLDETVGTSHPVTWWHTTGAGRASYTGHHRDESYSDTLFTRLRLPTLRVAVRAVRADSGEFTLPMEDRPCQT